MPDIRFPCQGQDTPGYLAQPANLPAPGVLVLQEWWGLDDHIRSVCNRLGAEGFVALAPDLYRQEPTTQPDEAQQRMMALSMDRAEKDMRCAAEHLISTGTVAGEHVGALGFCLGGGLAVWAAAASPLIAATVTYYYVMPHGKPDFTKISGAVLGHFGTEDEFVSVGDARALQSELREAGVETSFRFYNAGHAFFNDTNRLGTYNPEAATTSWERTVAFLRERLTPASG
jgi:carboxymethylenebutenolidase